MLAKDPEYQDGGVWLLVDIDVSRIGPAPQRVNISLPRYLVAGIDDYARAHGATRPGFLADYLVVVRKFHRYHRQSLTAIKDGFQLGGEPTPGLGRQPLLE
ncbi:MAG: type II toxin-antitoxin system HicB family antitoxin [Gammaproteobacteria bacterium]|nr:type II toxin-antitoxin system HicB family antitoxin [Gammaproteobacteria bacterium]MBU1653860.1 type II toxin-antitoxin system HicB family antitoxin [Gammaproteobacteria bacterium]MBU1960413.1 type II toxin-antitoxin system HicB family antitoxin [Gammaproteobacteria bacterium]